MSAPGALFRAPVLAPADDYTVPEAPLPVVTELPPPPVAGGPEAVAELARLHAAALAFLPGEEPAP